MGASSLQSALVGLLREGSGQEIPLQLGLNMYLTDF